MKDVFIHFDINNFFVGVETLLDPTLRGRAVAVCGAPEKRHGIVLAKSEVAKKLGVKTGMTIWQAKLLCPDLIIITPHHNEYEKYSKIVQQIYLQYSDLVEPFGIDECWVDVTKSLDYFKKTGRELADEVRNRVRTEVGLTISAGVSWNKTLAKLGSDMKKPDATTVIDRDVFENVVKKMPVGDMLFIGKKTVAVLERLNIKTVGDLGNADPKTLSGHFGVNAYKMVDMARGVECDPVRPFDYRREVKSVGNGTTLGVDLKTAAQVYRVAYMLCDQVTTRMRRKGVKGSTIHVSIRNTNLEWIGAQETLGTPTHSVKTVLGRALAIFNKIWTLPAPVRSLRIAVSNLTRDTRSQLSLFAENDEVFNDKISAAFDKIRTKHGTSAIAHGVVDDKIVIEDMDDMDGD